MQQIAVDVAWLRKKAVTPSTLCFYPNGERFSSVSYRTRAVNCACIHTLTVFPTISAAQSCWNTVTHWHKSPWGVVSAQIPPSCLPFLILSLLPLTRFQTCRLKHTWLHTHSPPPPLPFPPFTFPPCDISMATWKETSVLGELCDGVGCPGRGGGCSGQAGVWGGWRGQPGDRGVPTHGGQGIAGNNTHPRSWV